MDGKYYVLWGEQSKSFKMTERLKNTIFERLGIQGEKDVWDGFISPGVTSGELNIPSIDKCISRNNISFDSGERLYHSIGKGGADFARMLDGKGIRIVDAVIYPTEKELYCLMNNVDKDTGIIPYGGGTTVTEGLSPNNSKKYFISVDLRKMDSIVINAQDMVVNAGAGVKGPDLERELNRSGFTLGHFPESFLHSTVGGWIATNAAGQESNRYGKMKDIVVGIKMISPKLEIMDRMVPNQSSYFRPMDIAVGSEGAFGIVTEATLKIRKMPKKLFYQSFIFRDFQNGVRALKELFDDGIYPLVARLSDPVETDLSFRGMEENMKTKIFMSYLKMRRLIQGGSLLIIVNENGKIKQPSNSVSTGKSPAKVWREGRYDRPYLYNSLLKMGILADTIETSAPWSKIIPIYEEVKKSFHSEIESLGISGLIMCHLSHEYSTGSALYFTYLFYAKNNREERLNSLRKAILTSIIQNGGAISHHHGIGRSFKPFLREYEGFNYELIKSIKRTLDPDDIMNPGLIDLK
ncbi:MAG: FAD-binding oxidoreductase [Thermoplasmata archaeon]